MKTEQKYSTTGAVPTLNEPSAPQIVQTVHTPRLTADLALLRQYLDYVFYPWVFRPLAADTKSDDQSKDDDNPFGDFNIDLSDFDLGFDDLDLGFGEPDDQATKADDAEEAYAYYTPIQRVLMMHRLFVVFCGHRQADWWSAYVAELLHFFGECGETKPIVAITLREHVVMQTLRPFN
ncbi:hypothetical protein [uncultured Fibrella sp.]|uniref:hypothetical protein n=1 Tax=uncultured Fibrella sp. TaxID=1284596 RepID=UPI0035CC7957